VSGFRFRLYSDDMDELGEFETVVPNCSTGDEFMTGDGRRFRIVGIVPVPMTLACSTRCGRLNPSLTDRLR
jgi:hypothetical protein